MVPRRGAASWSLPAQTLSNECAPCASNGRTVRLHKFARTCGRYAARSGNPTYGIHCIYHDDCAVPDQKIVP